MAPRPIFHVLNMLCPAAHFLTGYGPAIMVRAALKAAKRLDFLQLCGCRQHVRRHAWRGRPERRNGQRGCSFREAPASRPTARSCGYEPARHECAGRTIAGRSLGSRARAAALRRADRRRDRRDGDRLGNRSAARHLALGVHRVPVAWLCRRRACGHAVGGGCPPGQNTRQAASPSNVRNRSGHGRPDPPVSDCEVLHRGHARRPGARVHELRAVHGHRRHRHCRADDRRDRQPQPRPGARAVGRGNVLRIRRRHDQEHGRARTGCASSRSCSRCSCSSCS